MEMMEIEISAMMVETIGNRAGDITYLQQEQMDRIEWLRNKGADPRLSDEAKISEDGIIILSYRAKVSEELWTEYRLRWA